MTKKSLLTLCVFAFSVFTVLGQFEKYSSFDELQSAAIAYYYENKTDSSILFLEYALNKYPEQEELLIANLGYVYSHTGNLSKAINLWKLGLEKGHFYGLDDEEYGKIYKDNPDFIKLKEIERKRNDASHVEYEVILPTNYNSKNQYPVIFIFHGNNSDIETEKIYWKSPVMHEKFISVFLQSYAHASSSYYQWKPEEEKTKNEFKNIYNYVMSEYSINDNKIIFSGMSAGGDIILKYAFNEIVPMYGIILNCPVIPDEIKDQDIKQFIGKNKKIGIITGSKDFSINEQKVLIERINNQKGQNKITIIEDLGHTFAENFSELFDEYLNWIIE